MRCLSASKLLFDIVYARAVQKSVAWIGLKQSQMNMFFKLDVASVSAVPLIFILMYVDENKINTPPVGLKAFILIKISSMKRWFNITQCQL
jgi:hypothetical protein